jgi:CCR4-NOT transcription complex subunit 6
LILVLSYGAKQGLIVGCNHIYYKAEDDYLTYVQHIQVDSFLRQLDQFKRKYPSYSVIYGGDFNTLPSTTVYNYILKESHRLGFGLRSSYSYYNESDVRRNGEPNFTNFTGKFKDTLDYIFYEEKGLQPTELRDIMDEKQLSAETALPNSIYSSDHICLQANFVLK